MIQSINMSNEVSRMFHPPSYFLGVSMEGKCWSKLTLLTCPHRRSFPQIQEVLGRLESYLRESGPGKVHDMTDIFSRESMDVIGVPRNQSLSPGYHCLFADTFSLRLNNAIHVNVYTCHLVLTFTAALSSSCTQHYLTTLFQLLDPPRY